MADLPTKSAVSLVGQCSLGFAFFFVLTLKATHKVFST